MWRGHGQNGLWINYKRKTLFLSDHIFDWNTKLWNLFTLLLKYKYSFINLWILYRLLRNKQSFLCLRCIANFLVSRTRQLRQSNSSRNQVSWLKLHGCEHECRICCKIQTWSNHPMIPTTKRTFALQHSSKAWCPLTFPNQ